MKNRNFLVTGSQGFIGFNFCEYLNKLNRADIIIGYDKLSDVSIKHSPNGPYKFEQGHTSDSSNLLRLLIKEEIDYVVDFAASSHVDNSIKDPDIFIQDNIVGKHGLLKACLEYQTKHNPNFKLLNISTDEVYGHLEKNDPSFTEESPYKPRNPYSASKAAGDHLVDSYIKTFGLNAITTHSCNNFGPNQDNTKFIPKVIENIFLNKEIPVYGKGEQIREWIHVEDNCLALLLALEKGKIGEHYNVGSGWSSNNISMVKNLINIIKFEYNINGGHLIKFVKDRIGHDFRYSIDSSKIKELELNYSYHIVYAGERLSQTVKWYKNKIESE